MTLFGTASRASVVAVVVTASALLTGCVSTVSGTAVRAQKAGQTDVAALDESKLEDVLLSADEINDIMGASSMTVTSELEEMTDHSGDVSDPACLGAIYGAEEPVYAGSGWTTMRDQVLREDNDDNDHWVEQTVVLYPSATKAQKFFDDSREAWESCADSSVSIDDGIDWYLWQLEGVQADDTLITQTSMQEDAGGWGCQHALSVVSNVTVETWACSYAVGDEAATIATDMVAKASE